MNLNLEAYSYFFCEAFPHCPPDTAFWICHFARLPLPQDCECLKGTDRILLIIVFSVPSLVGSICLISVPMLQ